MSTLPSSTIGIDARLLYYRKGGIPEYTRQLIEALADLDTVNNYAIVHNFRDKEDYLPAANFRRINAYTPAHHQWERFALSAELLPRNLDLFHSPDFIAPRQAARRHIITIHDLHFLYYPQFLEEDALNYYRNQIMKSVKRADHILVQTDGTKRDVMKMLNAPEEKITVHHLGVNPSFKPMTTEQIQTILAPYNLPSEYLLFVGTIEPRKNLPTLFKAYALMREKTPDIPPLVLGGQAGWHVEQEMATLDELGLRKHVVWFQNVPPEVLSALYAGATLLIIPSFHEGFGMPALEAMACGTPAVVTNRGSVPEVIGDAAVYLDPTEPETIVEAVLSLLNDTDRYQEFRRRGLERSSQYTWQRTAQIALDVYRSLL